MWFCADTSSHFLEHSVRSFRGRLGSTEKNLGEVVHRGMEGRSLRLAEDRIGYGAENWAKSLIESTRPAETA